MMKQVLSLSARVAAVSGCTVYAAGKGLSKVTGEADWKVALSASVSSVTFLFGSLGQVV